jgi:hypothetical protein
MAIKADMDIVEHLIEVITWEDARFVEGCNDSEGAELSSWPATPVETHKVLSRLKKFRLLDTQGGVERARAK